MATAKTIMDFPGAYSGQGRSWEERIKTKINLLPPVDGIAPKVALQDREREVLLRARAHIVAFLKRLGSSGSFRRLALCGAMLGLTSSPSWRRL